MFIELTSCLKACKNIDTAQDWGLLHGKLIPNKCGLQVDRAGKLFNYLGELRSVIVGDLSKQREMRQTMTSHRLIILTTWNMFGQTQCGFNSGMHV